MGAVAYIEQVVVTVHYSEPSIASNKTTRETSYQPFHVGVANNPTNNSFLISTTGSGGQPISLRVIDEAGRLLEARSALAANQSFRIGTNYTRGLYFAEITQGTKRKVLKLIKN